MSKKEPSAASPWIFNSQAQHKAQQHFKERYAPALRELSARGFHWQLTRPGITLPAAHWFDTLALRLSRTGQCWYWVRLGHDELQAPLAYLVLLEDGGLWDETGTELPPLGLGAWASQELHQFAQRIRHQKIGEAALRRQLLKRGEARRRWLRARLRRATAGGNTGERVLLLGLLLMGRLSSGLRQLLVKEPGREEGRDPGSEPGSEEGAAPGKKA